MVQRTDAGFDETVGDARIAGGKGFMHENSRGMAGGRLAGRGTSSAGTSERLAGRFNRLAGRFS
jgi:hypothetical protein